MRRRKARAQSETEARLLKPLRLRMLSSDQCMEFHEASLRILSEAGVRFFKEEALDLLRKHGAGVEGNLARIPRGLVEESLESCPKEFPWKGFGDETSVTVKHEPLVSPAVGPVFIQDIKNGRREADETDYANLIKLMHTLEIFSINGGLPIDIGKLPPERKYLVMMESMLRHTNKPILGFCLEEPLIRQTLGFYEAATGDSCIWDKGHYLAAVCTALSPLVMPEDTIDTIIEYASRNQILLITSCIMAGITGPIHPLGTALLQHTEILSGIVLAQCVRPGCPVVYSVASTAGYMQDASFGGGSPDAMMIHGPCIQTAIELYDIPIRTMTGINSAKDTDYQAGMETGMSALLSGLIGGGIWPQAMGVLDDLMPLSYEKLILDSDTLSRAMHVRKGFEFSVKALSIDSIMEVGPQGNFLTHAETFKNFRKLWTPEYMSWESRGAWEERGSTSLLEKANQAYSQILQESPDTLLSPDQEKRVTRAVAEYS